MAWISECARVLPLPLGVHSGRVEPGAGETVPGAVRVPGQTAVGALGAVEVALVQSDLGHAHFRAHVQLLLRRRADTGENSVNVVARPVEVDF